MQEHHHIAVRVRLAAIHLIVNLTLIFAIALASFGLMSAASTAFAQAAASTTQAAGTAPVIKAKFVRPNDMNTGALLLPSTRPGQYVEAPRLASDVDIAINGPIARVKVTQRFENPSDGWVEGVYVFPLPENSAVDTLRMRVGDRLIEGVIKVREEARRIYEDAKRDGRKAALLEQQRDNLFTNNIANIGPGETVIVYIEYQQTIRQDGGVFSLRFPMVVAPRYNPQPVIQMVDFDKRNGSGFGVVDPVPERGKIEAPVLDPRENAKINPVTLTVKLAAGFPLGAVENPYHDMISTSQDDETRILTLKNETVPADRDFELTWRASGDAPNAALFTEEVDGQHYLLAFLTPPRIAPAKLPKKDREVVFIIDNSGSMAGESIDQAKLALDDALSRLKPADTFNVVRFDDTFEVLFDDAVRADGENLAVARAFVRRLTADGGTEMLPALKAALVDRNAGDTQRVRQIVFITDGAIGNEQQLFDAIARQRGRSRVFTVGIGSAPNSFFMTRAAELGRGTFTHIGATGEVREKMGAFFAKLENPVLTGLSAQLAGRAEVGAVLSEVSPDPLPDLYLGEPVVLAAIIDKPSGMLAIGGDFAGNPWQVNMDIAQAAKGEGIGKLWARRKIAALEAARSYGSDWEAVNREVEMVALAHRLVSSRTSLVAVDVKVTRPGGEPLASTQLPLNLPDGWDADKWFGGEEAVDAPGPQKTFLQNFRKQATQLVAAAPTQEAAAKVARANQALSLPQTATPAERNMIIGLILMLLAVLSGAILRMYGRLGRKVRRADAARNAQARDRLP
ncbi:marine proteobacterial sortase target protein [Salaquimonas pukyongi]|uniref:marine proteobacterial sortase target protein n=1 Tax=Salaquimonas pukyongi TaxID=2712698 RepID=UPI00096B85AB|nr:marine proteobacterial sortase target protein [Salaquimonas pukyongi]